MTDDGGWYWYERRGGIPIRKLDADGKPSKDLIRDLDAGMEIAVPSYVGWYRAKVEKGFDDRFCAVSDGGMLFGLELGDDGFWGSSYSINLEAVKIGTSRD